MLAAAMALAAVPATPPAARSVEAAMQVVRSLDAREYRRAFALWSGGRSFAAYRAGYRHTVRTRVTPLPPFATEGGMGHGWAEIRVRVDALLDDGRRQRFAGRYTLSRVNDVDGSTAAQRRWHIVAASLAAVPAGR